MPSDQERGTPPAALQRRCLLAGLIFGLAGAVWIWRSHTWPERAWHYHVPLAAAFGCWAAWLVLGARGASRWPAAVTTLVALVVIAGRIGVNWPFSGHGILGALMAVLAPWPWLRALSAAIIAQALVTKWIRADDVLSVPYGAALGAGLAVVARWWAAAWSARPRRALGATDDPR